MKVTFNTSLTMDELAKKFSDVGGVFCPEAIGVKDGACARGDNATPCEECWKMVLTEVK